MADTLTVASFNLRNGRAFDGCNSWPFRRRAAAALLRELDADVIGMQEVYGFQLRYLLRQLPDYAAVGEGRSRRGERNPVLVRGRVQAHATRWFEVEGARFPRIATTARVEVGGVPLTFTSTHLDERSALRRRTSAAQLLRWFADVEGPHVIVGDFNDTLGDLMFEAFAAAGYRSALPDDAGGTSHHFTGRGDGRQIDHILVPAGVEVLAVSVVHTRPGGRLPSDHWPVVARIRI
ncbi:MAG TPA: endonuclease/exonuclease/phosphatase family protein [Acidimicrobiales bacterium]|nr:endonuclease/exonuclease/phosphatase family protein [Acidimicrobiales bacterium]